MLNSDLVTVKMGKYIQLALETAYLQIGEHKVLPRGQYSEFNTSFPLSSFILTETFTLVGGSVDEYFGANDVTKRQKHLHELRVTELLRQVVDEEIAAFWSRYRASCTEH